MKKIIVLALASVSLMTEVAVADGGSSARTAKSLAAHAAGIA